jgi:hypothetical protein
VTIPSHRGVSPCKRRLQPLPSVLMGRQNEEAR